MKYTVFVAVFLVAAVFLAGVVSAAVPQLVNYQGRLANAVGVPLDTTATLVFNIYADSLGVTNLWSETHTDVVIKEGLFQVLMGSTITLGENVFDGRKRWLGVQLQGGPAPTALIPIISVPYAYRAGRADTASFAQSSAGASKWTLIGSTLYTNNYWGISRGGAGNILHGDSAHTMTNLGTNSFTGTISQNYGYSTIAGGDQNAARAWNSTVGGGQQNNANSNYSTIAGGQRNVVNGMYGAIAGGFGDTVWALYGGSLSGRRNVAGDGSDDTAAFVGGGGENKAFAPFSTIAGGQNNLTASWWGTIGGGLGNVDSSLGGAGTIAGGIGNKVRGIAPVVAGGDYNEAFTRSFVGGGGGNRATGYANVIAGGYLNTIPGANSAIGGGEQNHITGQFSVIPGGYKDTITSNYSYLFGIKSKLTKDSTFMVDMPHIRFGKETGGYEFPTADGSAGQILSTGGAGKLSWTSAPAAGGWADDGTTVRLTTASDKVGIGTPSPKVQLDLTDMLRVGGCTWPAPGSGEGLELAYNPTNNLGYIQSYDRTTGNWMDLSIGARRVMVGDNTPAPSARLHIYNFTSDWNTPQLRLEEFGLNNYSSIIHSSSGLQFRNYYATGGNMAYSFGDPANALLFGVTAEGDVKIKGHVEFPTNSIIAFMGANTQDQYFNFYSGDYQSRSYDAHIRAYGQGSSGGYVEMNHDGANANILADAGDINIQPAANVGIGTSDPRDKLEVKGNVRLDNGVGGGAAVRFAEGGTSKWALNYRPWASGKLSLTNDIGGGLALMTMDPVNNRVGILQDNPAYRLDVNGDCHATSFPTSSDERFKKNIRPLENVLEKITRVRGVSFDWNETYDSLGRSNGRREIGVIAQEVEAQFPELVTKWGDQNYRAVDYGRLSAVLIEAVKELKAENEALKQRLEVLEKR